MDLPPPTLGVVSSLPATVGRRTVVDGGGDELTRVSASISKFEFAASPGLLTYGAASLLRRGLTKLARGAVMQIVSWNPGDMVDLSDGKHKHQCYLSVEARLSLSALGRLVRLNSVEVDGDRVVVTNMDVLGLGEECNYSRLPYAELPRPMPALDEGPGHRLITDMKLALSACGLQSSPPLKLLETTVVVIRLGVDVKEDLMCNLPSNLRSVALVLDEMSAAVLEHALWTLSFFPVTWLMICATTPTCLISPVSFRGFSSLSTLLLMNVAFLPDVGIDLDAMHLNPNTLQRFGYGLFTGQNELDNWFVERFSHVWKHRSLLLLCPVTCSFGINVGVEAEVQNLAVYGGVGQALSHIRNVQTLYLGKVESPLNYVIQWCNSLRYLSLHHCHLERSWLPHFRNWLALSTLEVLTFVDPQLSSEELYDFLLLPLECRQPLTRLELAGDWPDLVQRVLNLHIKQPQQRVKLVFSTADAAKTSLNAASEWLRQQDVKPATLSFHCQNTSVLPDNIAAFCRFPLMQQEVHLVVTPPQPKQRWHLNLVGNAGLIDRQLELFVPTQVQHLHIAAKDDEVLLRALEHARPLALVVELHSLSMPKVEWQSLGRDTPMAFTSRLLSLTMLGTLSLPPCVIAKAPMLRSVTMSQEAAECLGEEGIRLMHRISGLGTLEIGCNDAPRTSGVGPHLIAPISALTSLTSLSINVAKSVEALTLNITFTMRLGNFTHYPRCGAKSSCGPSGALDYAYAVMGLVLSNPTSAQTIFYQLMLADTRATIAACNDDPCTVPYTYWFFTSLPTLGINDASAYLGLPCLHPTAAAATSFNFNILPRLAASVAQAAKSYGSDPNMGNWVVNGLYIGTGLQGSAVAVASIGGVDVLYT